VNRDLTLAEEGAWPVDPYRSNALDAPQREEARPILDLPTLLRIVLEWRWLILATVAAGLAAAVAVTLLTTPRYRAFVTLQVNPPTVAILDGNNAGTDTAKDDNSQDFVATQVGLLSSSSLAERVAQDLNLASNPDFVPIKADPATRLRIAAGKVAANLDVIPPENGELIRYTYSSESPQLAAQIANAIADAFINSSLQRKYEASAYARNFLERQIAKTRGELENSERQLVQYAQAQGIINTGSADSADGSTSSSDAGSPQGESLIQLNQALSDATAKRIAAQGAYQAALGSGLTSQEASSTQPLQQQLAALEAQYQDKRTYLKPDHPEMVSLRSEIDELQKQIAKDASQVSNARINSLRADYEAAASAERSLQAKVAQLKGQVLNLRGRSIQYAILQRDVDTNRALYNALLQRYKEVGVAGGIGTSPVSIVDHANVPSAPYKPRLMLNLLIGVVLGFLAGMGVAIVLEYISDTIKTREDVRKKLGIPCLGSIPKRSGKDFLLQDLTDPASPVSEAYSTVVASLQFSTESGVPKILLASSARSGEGKSSSVLALAQNFARRGNSVLLIDCDLRKPAFKSASGDIGLTKLLTNDDPVAAHVSATQYENLWLLGAGPLPPNPADLLSTGRFQAILREAAAQFDMVLIDAPPVLGLADSSLLAAICKNVVFVVESGKTRRTAAVEAVNRLRRSGAHVLGAILSKSVEERRGYGYGYSYSYGYGYGKYGAVDRKRSEIALIPQQVEE
jgi:capsular exopolysaccharide synthesis family protein